MARVIQAACLLADELDLFIDVLNTFALSDPLNFDSSIRSKDCLSAEAKSIKTMLAKMRRKAEDQ